MNDPGGYPSSQVSLRWSGLVAHAGSPNGQYSTMSRPSPVSPSPVCSVIPVFSSATGPPAPSLPIYQGPHAPLPCSISLLLNHALGAGSWSVV